MRNYNGRPGRPGILKETKAQLNSCVEINNMLKPCIFCGGEVKQKREAFFICSKCGQEFIACVEDMEK